MGIFLVYIIKSAVCLAIFYLFYRLLLSRETFHRFNRFALLGILLWSCLLPLVEISVKQPTGVQNTLLTLEEWLSLVGSMDAVEAVAPQATIPWWVQGVMWIYVCGIVFFVCRNLYSLGCLALLLRSGRREDICRYVPNAADKATLLVHNREIAPFSWLKFIVISRKDLEENGREILTHELAHIRRRHSLDLLLADVCIFFQWFNPASWLLKQELQNIHEYEADEAVINQGIDAKQYQLLLIKKAVGTRLYSMANSFNHSKLKKRITMMTKEKSSSWARLKYLYVLPVAAIAVTAFARPEVSEVTREISNAKVNDLVTIAETNAEKNAVAAGDTAVTGVPLTLVGKPVEVTADDNIYNEVDKMPEYPGGVNELLKYLSKNVRYPEAAKKAKKQGRVVVQFVVDKEGNITNPSVVRGVDKDLDAEAVRVISSMPRWTPGMQDGKAVAVKYTIPVMFRLNTDTKKNVDSQKDSLLFLLDGKEIDASGLSKIDPSTIESIKVLKDENSTKPYGEKGKNGVVLVKLKAAEKK